MTDRRALVLGAGGFIGSNAANSLSRAGWTVSGAGRSMRHKATHEQRFTRGDFSDARFTSKLLGDLTPDVIVFAAGPADVQQSYVDPVRDFSNQLLPLINVLDAARKLSRVPAVLLVSSAAVYGNPAAIPVGEDAPLAPISPYGFHKIQQELLLDEYRKVFGVRTCKARVFSTYGPGLRHLAVWDIAQRALRGDFSLHGSGQESRDYLHVHDVGRGLAHLCRHAPFEGEAINIASGQETPIGDLARMIYAGLGVQGEPRFQGDELSGSPLRWRADVSRLHALGFAAEFAAEDGLRETMKWIVANG
jgi:UDP-glucose 4-epimerase